MHNIGASLSIIKWNELQASTYLENHSDLYVKRNIEISIINRKHPKISSHRSSDLSQSIHYAPKSQSMINICVAQLLHLLHVSLLISCHSRIMSLQQRRISAHKRVRPSLFLLTNRCRPH